MSATRWALAAILLSCILFIIHTSMMLASLCRVVMIFACYEPSAELIDFARQIADEISIDIYIVVDSNRLTFRSDHRSVSFVQYPEDLLTVAGFTKASHKGSPETKVSAWDKVLYWIAEESRRGYDYYWILEDDVFIPSMDVVKDILQVLPSQSPDLFSQKLIRSNETWIWHKTLPNYQGVIWYQTMLCSVILSNNWVNHYRLFKKSHPVTVFFEALLPTIATHYGLKIYEGKQMEGIRWRFNDHVDTPYCEVSAHPDILHHPLKKQSLHFEYRELLREGFRSLEKNCK